MKTSSSVCTYAVVTEFRFGTFVYVFVAVSTKPSSFTVRCSIDNTFSWIPWTVAAAVIAIVTLRTIGLVSQSNAKIIATIEL